MWPATCEPVQAPVPVHADSNSRGNQRTALGLRGMSCLFCSLHARLFLRIFPWLQWTPLLPRGKSFPNGIWGASLCVCFLFLRHWH